jgi:glutathione S-transferase
MDYLEGVVPEPGGFLVGDGITLADIAVASPFVNLRHMDMDLSRWPKTLAYVDSILSRPSFATLIETENRIFGRAA